jgi:hypothetical protein
MDNHQKISEEDAIEVKRFCNWKAKEGYTEQIRVLLKLKNVDKISDLKENDWKIFLEEVINL